MTTRFKHTLESISIEAKNFATRSAFKRGAPKHYDYACAHGLLDNVCAHMQALLSSPSKEEIISRAKPYNTRTEFSRNDKKGYEHAKRKGWLDLACQHMKAPTNVKLDKSAILDRAKTFSTRRDFQKLDAGGYVVAWRNGWLDEACSHMPEPIKKLTKYEVLARAKPYQTRGEFQKGDQSAYQVAYKNGWLDETCAHMKKGYGKGGFNDTKPGFLYQIKFKLNDGSTVWKVGITNLSAKKRIAGMGVSSRVSYEVTHEVRYEVGIDARNEETRLIKAGLSSGKIYTGSRFIANGFTELFLISLL